MVNVEKLQTQNQRRLNTNALAKVAEQVLGYIDQMGQQIASQAQAVKFRDVKIERITFELARLKAWKFAARTHAVSAEQRQLFVETLAGDEAGLQARRCRAWARNLVSGALRNI